VVAIAGTGSVAFAQCADGRRTRAGGWGYIVGDEGSAYDIACQALNAVLKAFDGRGPPTALTPALLAACGAAQPPDLVGYVYGSGVDRHALARLAVHVSRAADEGDVVAMAILDRAGDELAALAAAAARAAGLEGKVRCGLAGGVLIHAPRVRDRLVAQMAERGLVAEPQVLVEEPALGAIWIARSLV
jgi:N-acetylglucosamine kinase-like BadF-type ATPase